MQHLIMTYPGSQRRRILVHPLRHRTRPAKSRAVGSMHWMSDTDLQADEARTPRCFREVPVSDITTRAAHAKPPDREELLIQEVDWNEPDRSLKIFA